MEDKEKLTKMLLGMAAAATALIAFILFGTLWLCLNVSWWFATIYAVLIIYYLVLVFYAKYETPHKPDTK